MRDGLPMSRFEQQLAIAINTAYANIPVKYHDYIDRVRQNAGGVVSCDSDGFNDLCRTVLPEASTRL